MVYENHEFVKCRSGFHLNLRDFTKKYPPRPSPLPDGEKGKRGIVGATFRVR